MGYIVTRQFADLTDGKRLYFAGEKFPREGLAVSDGRLAELAGSGNRTGHPVIEKVDDPAPDTAEKAPISARKRVKRNAD